MPTQMKLMKIRASGCGDANPDEGPPGIMSALSNLVPDPGNQGIWVPRPAASALSGTQAQFSPGFISALFISGQYAYGMVSSARNAGKDEPFVYDLIGGSFLTVTGITSANVPTSPGTSGAWTPPTMDQVGVFILVTHPGFNGGGNGFFGWFDITTPTSPVWASGNFSPRKSVVTISNASPAVITISDLSVVPYETETVKFTTTGTLPAGIFPGTTYYIIKPGLTFTQFQIALTPGGTAINTTSSGTGVHTGTFGNSITLPSPATFVKQFNQRAFFAVAPTGVAPATYASDTLAPLNCTNPLILTYGDSRPIYALGTLGLHNILGGITQALLVFKDNNIFQLTGDWAGDGSAGSILVNSLNVSVGTIAPLSVVPTPKGVSFLSQDGFRIIDWNGTVSDPIGIGGDGVVIPFTQALVPSRVVGASNGQTIRITTQNNAVLGQPFQEWVFDLERNIWHGPHTFPFGQISRYGNSYVLSPVGVTGLWSSDILPSSSSQYTENSVSLTWSWETALLSNHGSIFEQAVINSTIYCAGSGDAQRFTMTAESTSGAPLSVVPVAPPVPSPSKWGSMTWGVNVWGAKLQQMSHIVIPWDQPLVFDRVKFRMNGMSAVGVAVGEMRVVTEELEYMALTG